VKLDDALKMNFEGFDDRDGFPFDGGSSGITIRVHVGSRGHWFTATNSFLPQVCWVSFQHRGRKEAEEQWKAKCKVDAGV
jgi:hypothetical protein